MSGKFPENIDIRNGKTFDLTRPAGVNDEFPKFEVRFYHSGRFLRRSRDDGRRRIVRILLNGCEERMAKRTRRVEDATFKVSKT